MSDNVQLFRTTFDNVAQGGGLLWLGVFVIAWNVRNALPDIWLGSVRTRTARICCRRHAARIPSGHSTARADRLRVRAAGVATICGLMRFRGPPTFVATGRRMKSSDCGVCDLH